MGIALLDPVAPEDFAAAVDRLVLTRWLGSALVVALALACVHLLGIPLPVAPMLWLGGALAGYNAVIALLAARLRRSAALTSERRVRSLRRLVVAQVLLDWISMTAFVHFTGGVTSPAIPLFFIHMLVVTVLAPTPSPYVYLALAVSALIALTGLENIGTLAHYRVLPLPEGLHRDMRFVSAQIAFFGITSLASVHLTRPMVARLRERDRQVAALLDATQAAAASIQLDEVLDQLVESAARALSAKAAAIRLLDQTGERMEVIASTGLSERYLNKGFSGRSETDRQAMSGAPVIVSDALADPRIQCRDEVAAEGIGCVLIVPVSGRRGPLGVMRVYAERRNAFGPEDVTFALSIASQGAVAIENALVHEALQRTERSRGQFVRTVTHELRSPLAGAISLIRVIVDGLAGDLPAEQRGLLTRVDARLASLTELVDDLLALAASQSADLGEKPVDVDLTAALRRVVEHHSAQGATKGVHVGLEVPAAPPAVRATDQGLDRIFGNLIGNAVKYTPHGGRVEVRVSVEDNCVEVTVADTGIGIPAADLPRLFEEFFRAGNVRTSEITGTGLGLAIVKRIVTSYGGVIGVRSAIDEGTMFTVVLPLAESSRDDRAALSGPVSATISDTQAVGTIRNDD
jgi:signal transduction histidine kinase